MIVVITLSPRDYDAVLFDLDGVLTKTASVHAAAWKKLFDSFLEQRATTHEGEPFVPFDMDTDYLRYVDGKPRYDGVTAFLESRGIKFAPEGPDVQSVQALGKLKDRFEVVNHSTYTLVSDGDLMEGVASEAASLAGHLRLGKLICLYDDNRITLSASTRITFTEDIARRFEAYGWHTQTVENGNDLEAIDRALRAAQAERERPSLILVRTHIGYGSPHKQDTFEAHGSPLGPEEVQLTTTSPRWAISKNPGDEAGDLQGSTGGGWSHAGRNLHFGVGMARRYRDSGSTCRIDLQPAGYAYT